MTPRRKKIITAALAVIVMVPWLVMLVFAVIEGVGKTGYDAINLTTYNFSRWYFRKTGVNK